MVFRRRREKKKATKKTVPDETIILPEPEESTAETLPELDEPIEPEKIESSLDETTETVIDTFEKEETPAEAPIVETMPDVDIKDEKPIDEEVSVEELTDELVKTEDELSVEPLEEEPIEEPIVEPTTDDVIDLSVESEEEIVKEAQEIIEEEKIVESEDEPIEITDATEPKVEPPVMTPLTATEEQDVPDIPPLDESIDETLVEEKPTEDEPVEEVITVIKEADAPAPEVPEIEEQKTEEIEEEPVIEEQITDTEAVEASEPEKELFTHPDSNVKVSEYLKEKETVETIEEPKEPELLEEIDLTLKVPKELYNFLKSVLQLFEWSYDDSKQYLNYLLLDSIEEAIKNNFGQVPGSEKLINKLDKIIEDFKKQL